MVKLQWILLAIIMAMILAGFVYPNLTQIVMYIVCAIIVAKKIGDLIG